MRRNFALSFKAREHRRLVHPAPDQIAKNDKHGAEQERDWPTPVGERISDCKRFDPQDHSKGDKEAQSRCSLNEGSIEATPPIRGMLSHVSCRPAILPAQGKALDEPQSKEKGRREKSGLRIRRKQADREGRATHQEEGKQEGVLPPDYVPDPAEEDGAERTHDEAGREDAKRLDESGSPLREENRGEGRRQNSEDIEVVPLDHRSGGTCRDDFPYTALADFWGIDRVLHVLSLYTSHIRISARFITTS